jgi:hypothetical protein
MTRDANSAMCAVLWFPSPGDAVNGKMRGAETETESISAFAMGYREPADESRGNSIGQRGRQQHVVVAGVGPHCPATPARGSRFVTRV